MLELKKSAEVASGSKEGHFNFLCNMNNWQQLMPENKISNWRSDENSCGFNIDGLAELELEVSSSSAPNSFVVTNPSRKPFPITINWTFPNDSEIQLEFKGDMNPFLKMMAEKPLNAFFDILVENFKKLKA